MDYDDSGIVEIEALSAKRFGGRGFALFGPSVQELLYGMVQVSAELRPMRKPREGASPAEYARDPQTLAKCPN